MDTFNYLNFNQSTLALVAIGTSLFCLYYDFTFNRIKRKTKLSGPTPWPVFGNLFSYLVRPRKDVEREWASKYGKLYIVFIGSEPRLIVAHHEVAQIVSVTNYKNFINHRANFPEMIVPQKINWLFYLQGSRWKEVRQYVQPSFSVTVVKNISPQMARCADELILRLKSGTWKEANNSIFGIRLAFAQYAYDVVTRCFYSFRLPNNEIKLDDNSEQKKSNTLQGVVNNILNLQAIGFFTQYIFLIAPYWFHKLVGVTQTHNDLFSYVSNGVKTVYNNRKGHVGDYLQKLHDANVELTNKNIEDIKNNQTTKQNEQQIVSLRNEEMMTLLVFTQMIGMETVGNLMSHTAYSLAHHQSIQDKLYSELISVFKDKNSINNEDIYNQVMDCKYLNAVINETLRTMSPIVSVDRETEDDFTLEEHNLTIPRKLALYLDIHAIHHDPDVWPEPSVFDPQRFMPENKDSIPPGAFLPFGIGPRQCTGMKFALTETKIVIAKVILNYKLHAPKDSVWPPNYEPTINLRLYEPFGVLFEER